MSGRPTPRNGVLAQLLDFVKTMTGSDRTIQRVVGASLILGPLGLALVLLLLLALVVLVLAGKHVDVRLLGLVGASCLCGFELMKGVRRRRKGRRGIGSLDAPARKDRGSDTSGDDGEEATDGGRDEQPDSSVGT